MKIEGCRHQNIPGVNIPETPKIFKQFISRLGLKLNFIGYLCIRLKLTLLTKNKYYNEID